MRNRTIPVEEAVGTTLAHDMTLIIPGKSKGPVFKKGHKIMEIPISYNPRNFKEGKKITWRDGIKAVYYLIKYRFFN